MNRLEKTGSTAGLPRPERKRAFVLALALCLAAVLLAGCGARVNVSKDVQNVEDMIVNQDLIAEPAAYREDGSYTFTFYYDRGGFQKMDLSQAFVAYYHRSVLDQINMILDEETEELIPLPEDVQASVEEAVEAEQLQKIAVIKIKTLNDNTLEVSFKDRDEPLPGKEYFFVIPNMGLAGSAVTD